MDGCRITIVFIVILIVKLVLGQRPTNHRLVPNVHIHGGRSLVQINQGHAIGHVGSGMDFLRMLAGSRRAAGRGFGYGRPLGEAFGYNEALDMDAAADGEAVAQGGSLAALQTRRRKNYWTINNPQNYLKQRENRAGMGSSSQQSQHPQRYKRPRHRWGSQRSGGRWPNDRSGSVTGMMGYDMFRSNAKTLT